MSAANATPRAEQARATVLFADVVGFGVAAETLGTEAAYLLITGCLRQLDAIARRHGGSVDKYQGDKLMAVFGYPVPLERAAHAAAAAALEMRERVASYVREAGGGVDLGVHVGINTGDLVAGDIRGPVVREFHVLGDAVNVAARLKAKASEGAIYLGPATAEELAARFALEPLEPLVLKGKSAPVPAFALRGSRGVADLDSQPDPVRAPPLLGRDEALAALRARAEQLTHGSRAVVLVLGPQGSGRSRLLAELASELRARGVRVLSSRPAPGARARALATWRELAEAAADAGDGEPAALALLLDDADEADDASLVQLAELAAHGGRPVLVAAALAREPEAAPSPALEALRSAGARVPVDEIVLGPLDEADARRLVAAVAVDVAADGPLSDLVIERGAGLPARLVTASFLAPSLRSERELTALGRVERTRDAERRRMAVLFADITGFTALTERVGAAAAYPVVARCLDLLDETARAHGGTVDHYLGDCVLALFGVPEAIEDAPRAALNAALEMRRRLREHNEQLAPDQRLDVHVGVATGLGIAGDVSGPLLREFAVMGEHVDVAERLTDLAPAGCIYACAETYALTRNVFPFRAQGSVVLPGRSAVAWSFELLATAPKLHRARIGSERQVFSELVGRERELALLRERLAALARGEGGVVSLVAEAGIGKSRLLAELGSSTEAQHAVWREGRSLSTGRNLSFHPIADLCRSWAGIDDDDDEVQARAKLDEAVGRLLGDSAESGLALLASIVGVALRDDERERLAQIQGDALVRIVHGSLTELLRRASRLRPVVVVMEDLHWADLSSIELLESLLKLAADHPVLFVNAFRPGFPETSGRIQELTRRLHPDRHLEIAIEPLDGGAARRLLRNVFRGADIPHATRTRIEERARGNPFYIEEVARTLLDAGAIELRGGDFVVTEKLAGFEIPGTVQEAVMARVDRLDLRRKAVLQAAAVIGGSFHVAVLDGLVKPPGEAEAILEELTDREFVVPSDRMAGAEYVFKHPLIQEVTYDALLETRRRELHAAVAGAIGERLPDDTPGYYGMLAYHYGRARDVERAEEYLFLAGDEAARVAASGEALRFFREASALYLELHGDGGDPGKRAVLEKKIGLALFHRGQLIEAVEHFDASLSLLGVRVARSELERQLRFAADMLAILPRLYVARGGPRPAADPVQREVIEVMFLRGLAQTTTAPTRFVFDTMATLRRLLALDPPSIPEAGSKISGAVGIFSYGGLSFALGERFLQFAGRVIGDRDAPGALYYRVVNFVHHFLLGNWTAEHEIDDEHLRAGLRDGRLWEVTTYLGLAAEVDLRRGQWSRAREKMSRIDEIWERYEYDLAKTNHYWLPTCLALEQRRFPDAQRAAELYYDENPEDLLHLLALSCRARADTLSRAPAEAERALARAAEIVARARHPFPFHLSSYRTARFAADVARLDGEETAAEPARLGARRRAALRSGGAALAVVGKVVYRQPEVFRLWGRLEASRGRTGRALSWWQRSLAVAERLGAEPERARTLLAAGRGLEQAGGARVFAGRSAASCGDEAAALFEKLGLDWDLEQAQRSGESKDPVQPAA